MLNMLAAPIILAQHDIPIGTWRNHLSYQNLNNLLIVENKVYAAGNFGFMYFDKEDNSVNTLSKINGFGASDVSAMAYDKQSKIVVIGYASGNIDFIKDNTIINNYQVSNAPETASKKVNHMSFHGHLAFLSTGIGVVVIDLNTLAIKEVYENIGPDGSPIEIYASIIFSDSLFIATSNGIMVGQLSENINLKDPLNWRLFTEEDGVAPGEVKHINIINNKIYAGIDFQGLYVYEQNKWDATPFIVTSEINSISTSQNKLLISLPNELYVLSENDQFKAIADALIKKPGEAAFDEDGNIWISDEANGLISNFEGSFKSYSPEGPLKNDILKLYFFNDKIISLSGNFSSALDPQEKEASFSILENGKWKNYAPVLNNLPNVPALVDVAYQSTSSNLYFATLGAGILEWDQNSQFNIINDKTLGSTLQSSGGASSTIITSIKTDIQDKIWVTNYNVPYPVHSFNPPSEWNRYAFNFLNASRPRGIEILSNGDKWVALHTENSPEILVFNESNNKERVLKNELNRPTLPGNRVTDLAQDQQGWMWIGTNQGLVYVMDAFNVLDITSLGAFIPRVDNFSLWRTENITALKVDGGNRLWIGTTKGLYLYNISAESLIHSFNINNSPLPSNHIYDIEINERSGEVFIATSKGLISYRGTATKAVKAHENVKIFPNPVRPNFTGQLGISGLSENAVVKVTDMGGRLVRELHAEGGTAVWDVNDNRGKRVSGGVYLVLSASSDGKETFVGKIAVIE